MDLIERKIEECENDICYSGDGPVNRFTAIYRAIEMAGNSNYTAEVIANALDNVITELGDDVIPSSEFSLSR